MDNFNLDSDFFTGLPYFNELQEEGPLLFPAYASSRQLSWPGHSAQVLNLSHPGYFKRQVTNQDTPGSFRQLNSFSVSYLPRSENDLAFPEFFSKEDLAEIFSHRYFNEPNDDIEFTDLNSTDFKQIPSGYSSVTLSGPSSRPVATVSPLTKWIQPQTLTETVKFKATESSGSGGPLPPALEELTASNKRKASQVKYAASEKSKASRAKSQAKYAASAKGKASQAKYKASDKYKVSKAISNAKFRAYQSALKQGLSEKLARKKGELIAIAKKTELSSASVTQAVQSPDCQPETSNTGSPLSSSSMSCSL